jgi:mannose-6-phosphate isomerase-like protein (cupin superfamily)
VFGIRRVDKVRDLIPGLGAMVEANGLGIMYRIVGEQSGGALALLEVTLGPGLLGAPPHMHWNEDEVSCVLEGELVVQLGERVVTLKPGETLFKPRGVFHAFWNPGSAATRFLEFIAPAGFEEFFCEMAPLVPAEGPPDADGIVALAKRYQVEFDLSRVPELLQQYGVRCTWSGAFFVGSRRSLS